ncbi:MAG: hypothetical protein EA347_09955 [Thioalkalivibrio sp.]|nr:MAG: hypothetical protein EA347_09955 [Thioalkalivibrio sp.]
MNDLRHSLAAFGTPDFTAVLRADLAALGPDALGLQQALSTGSTAMSDDIEVMLLRHSETPDGLCVRIGVFFTSVLGGCACADDPTPENEHPEYCELDIAIARETGAARIQPAPGRPADWIAGGGA